jgi:N12 class adenine-specific DNA methylase/adenine-specific DNA methylase
MSSNVQALAQMADHTATQITASHTDWTDFLTTAARLYKYPYHEQLMIFAQRPDATACADYEVWNEKMRRYVRRGSKGIALIDASGDKPRLHYVFDISDTGGGENSRRPFLWQYRPEHEDAVTTALEREYTISGEKGLSDQLEKIAGQRAKEYWQNHQYDILHIVDDSFLEEYDEFNIGVQFQNAAAVSITYALMSRCGLEPDEYFEHEDFLSIFDFNTPDTVATLGTAVSEGSQRVLRQIEVTIKNYEREHLAERGATHGEQPDLHEERGLLDSKPDDHGADREHWEIREDAEELSEGAPSGPVQQPAFEREAVPTPAGDRTDGDGAAGPDDAGADEVGGRDGEPESLRTDEMGGPHEQPESPGRGNDSDGAYIQLTLFPSEQEQIQRIDEAESEKPSAIFLPVNSVPQKRDTTQADIDAAIQEWNGDIKSKHTVVRYMREHARDKDTAAFLRAEYGDDLPAFPVTAGNTSTDLPWPKVQRRIAQLIAADRFYTEAEYDNLDDVDPVNIRERLAQAGIVNGEVVDEEKLNNSPIIRQMTADVERIVREEQAAPPDLSSQPITRTGDTLTIGNGDTAHEVNVTLSDEEWQAVQQAIPESSESSLPYEVGDTIYLEDGKPFIVENIGNFDVRLSDPSLIYPISRSESKENLSRLLERYPQPDIIPSPSSAPEQPAAENFRITDDHLGEGGVKVKYGYNIAVIRTLKTIEAEGRAATPEEQETLSRYVGWGGIPQAFDPGNASWSKEYAELKEALTDEEYESARASTLNAHYTSPTVIKAIYEAVGNMGFQTGNILEPACGAGNFFGLLPEEMSGSKLYGVELDSITGWIAKQLYPDADITVAGFETTDRRDFFDLAVGNVPFGQYQVNDRAYNKLGFSIHDYFFAKTLDQVRAGGVIAFVTSRYTMDKQSPEVRRYIARRAELLGAIRLPNNAFKANAGTEVVSDIIFLQKRDRPIEIEPDWVHLGQNEDGFAINSYFVEHPEMILGRQTSESTQYGRQDFTVAPIEGLELADQLHDAVKYIHGQYTEEELPDLGENEEIDDSIPAAPDVKNYSYTIVDGKVYYRENSRMVRPKLNDTAKERVNGMVELRDCVHKLIGQQLDAFISDETIRETQAELNRLYDNFAAKYGLINSRGNSLAFSEDSSYYLLCSLEVIDEDGNMERKADMFTKRTIKQQRVVTSVDTASEALALSIAEKARVDLPYMASLTGKTSDELVDELRGVIFRLPEPVGADENLCYVTSDEYLSGNVREKLQEAERALAVSDVFQPNAEALKAAQPKDLDASEIEVRLGATWIGKEYIQEFMYELLNPPFYLRNNIQVNYAEFTAEWNITGKNSVGYNNVAAYVTHGTDRANAYRILEDTLNLRDVRIYDTVTDPDGKERRVLNSKETTLAQQKQQAIKDAFRDWIWKDPERRQTLTQKYNELFNSCRPREYDGRHITFSGINPEITLREHQLNAVAHILYGGNTLLAHEVGAGKTFEMVAAAMESKRLGLCQKSLFAVPNHLTEQWASEFLRLYPSANILVATKKDFETRNRKKFCSRIATGDYDAVIIGHSQFEKIPVSVERQERLLQEQIWEIEDGLEELKDSRAEQFITDD